MRIAIPELALVVLIGPSGSGKSTFAAAKFLPTETVSSDACRALVSDDYNNLEATKDAFEILHAIAAKRLERGRLTVVDATNVQKEARAPLVAVARKYHCIPVAIVLDLPEKVCQERNRARPDRSFGSHVIRRQRADLRRYFRGLGREGFRHVFVLTSEEEATTVEVAREPLWNNRKTEHGPFDIIGDVHGCGDELEELLGLLGYTASESVDVFGGSTPLYRNLEARTAVFLGDLNDRGPRVLDAIRIVKAMVDAGSAICLPGNHDVKLMRKLRGKNVQITHGLDVTLADLERIPEEQRTAAQGEIADFIDRLVSHFVFDDGKLVVAHAGMKESMQGRGSGSVREFALFGETTGETDEFGLPVRYNWAADYRGRARVVYGHTPVPLPEWLNGTINIDTGCVFGGALTAFRYPEDELVSVRAHSTYAEPARPIESSPPTATEFSLQQEHDAALDVADVLGKRIVETRLAGNVTVREENATAALEVMSRFAVDPRWLVYLPPTMSPGQSSARAEVLEHPDEVFSYYAKEGVSRVVCEEKHMGSRAVIVVCRDDDVGRERFGVEGSGITYTRTGRPMFEDGALGAQLLSRLRAAIEAAGLWEELDSGWMILDCELMPWSAKAQGLLRNQYAAVGAAARAALMYTIESLESPAGRLPDASVLLEKVRKRQSMTEKYVEAYRRYCWPVESMNDYKIAPFHLLASEGSVHTDRDHAWHMDMLARLAHVDGELFLATPYKVVNLEDHASFPVRSMAGPTLDDAVITTSLATDWWSELTHRGGEGIVVKPMEFLAQGRRGVVQPALKCRGREYLRIIYGPEYTEPQNLERLRRRSTKIKRSLAFRELALGVEGLERFVRREPLRRIHECVFAVLALESEPVDPRL